MYDEIHMRLRWVALKKQQRGCRRSALRNSPAQAANILKALPRTRLDGFKEEVGAPLYGRTICAFACRRGERKNIMLDRFSTAEVNFVLNGANLWYVEKQPGDGWNVVRWSQRSGRFVISSALPTEEKAEQSLWSYVCPSSSRTKTVISYRIKRPNRDREIEFPHFNC
jgi:hypothetical protein